MEVFVKFLCHGLQCLMYGRKVLCFIKICGAESGPGGSTEPQLDWVDISLAWK